VDSRLSSINSAIIIYYYPKRKRECLLGTPLNTTYKTLIDNTLENHDNNPYHRSIHTVGRYDATIIRPSKPTSFLKYQYDF